MHASEAHSVVLQLYRLLSGPADHQRDWGEIRGLFRADAVLLSELTLPDGTHESGRWTVDEFCTAAEGEYRNAGFWEREVFATTERFGSIAHVWSTYESRIGDPESAPVGRGINSVQLQLREGVWRIVSLIFQIERGTSGIPGRYLPKPLGGA